MEISHYTTFSEYTWLEQNINIRVQLTLSESEHESNFFSLIFVAAQCEHYIGFFMNPPGSDVAFIFTFAPIQTNHYLRRRLSGGKSIMLSEYLNPQRC